MELGQLEWQAKVYFLDRMEGTVDDCSSGPPCKLQVFVHGKYRPCIIRGRMIHEQTSKFAFPEKRRAGATNVDLWWDGSIYPCDPRTGMPPNFVDHGSLLEFVGDGEKGLLGYALSLKSMGVSQRNESEIRTLRERIDELESERRQESTELRREVQLLKDRNSHLQSSLTGLQKEIATLQSDLDESIQSEVQLESDIDLMNGEHARKLSSIDESHRVELQDVKFNFGNTSKTLSTLQRQWKRKFSRLQSTLYGHRKLFRARRDIATLAPGGGQAKSSRRLVRSIIAPATIRAIQEGNATNRTKQRFYGTEEQQIQSGKMLGQILSKIEVNSMLETPALQSVGVGITNRYLEKIGTEVGAHEILGVLDDSGITQSAYRRVYTQFKEGAKIAGKGLRIGCLPKPFHISLLRQQLNSKLTDFVGQYYSINNSIEFPVGSKSKKKEPVKIKLTSHNSLFCDIEAVQRTMVLLYQITLAGKCNLIHIHIYIYTYWIDL